MASKVSDTFSLLMKLISRPVFILQWSSPAEAMEHFKSQEIWIAPPQFYELCRLCNFSSLSQLHEFSSQRALEGCERWMPVILNASDGYIQLLPGQKTNKDSFTYIKTWELQCVHTM